MLTRAYLGKVSRITIVGACLVGVAVIICVICAIFVSLPASSQLPFLATVKDDAEFQAERRRPNGLSETTSLPRDQGLAVLSSLARARPWEPNKYAIFRGRHLYHPPGLGVVLVWRDSVKDARSRRQFMSIFIGNRLFQYGARYYEVPTEGQKVLDQIFPTNHYGAEAGAETK
jgi:hypothetical protein